jgi:hypothetical protein
VIDMGGWVIDKRGGEVKRGEGCFSHALPVFFTISSLLFCLVVFLTPVRLAKLGELMDLYS